MESNLNSPLEDVGIVPTKNYSELLQKSLIHQNITVEEPEIVFGIGDASIFTKKSISLLIAKAKAGKTSTATWIIAQAIKRSINVVWFDTEQGKYYASRTQNWILQTAELTSSLHLKYFDFKTHNTEDRIKLIEEEIQQNPPDIIVIDGVRDLVYDINSPSDATHIVTYLMKWADNYNCHILTILHQNKNDGQARGHLGTELVNKSETVIKISQNAQSQIVVEPEYTRGKPFEPFALERDNNGIPKLINEFQYQQKTPAKKQAITPDSYSIEKHRTNIEQAFIGTTNLTYNVLVGKIKEGYGFGFSKAKEFIRYYIEEGLVIKDDTISSYSKYSSGLT